MPEDVVEEIKKYLRETVKPKNLTVSQWITRVKIINNLLEIIEDRDSKFTEKQLVREVISPNIPSPWRSSWGQFGYRRLATLDEVERKLQDFEKTEVVEERQTSRFNNKKNNYKRRENDNSNDNPDEKGKNNNTRSNPCRIHPGEHE